MHDVSRTSDSACKRCLVCQVGLNEFYLCKKLLTEGLLDGVNFLLVREITHGSTQPIPTVFEEEQRHMRPDEPRDTRENDERFLSSFGHIFSKYLFL